MLVHQIESSLEDCGLSFAKDGQPSQPRLANESGSSNVRIDMLEMMMKRINIPGVAFIIGLVLISTCVCYGFKKRKQNMKQAASVTNRNPTCRNDYTDVHIKRDVVHFENKTYGCDSLEECK